MRELNSNAIQLWGRLSSINVRKVEFCLCELQQLHKSFDWLRHEAGGSHGVVNTAQYAALNPNQMVPVLKDSDGTVLWESNVIVRYLCARYASELLYPQTLPARFVAEQWMDWQQTTLNPAGRAAFIQLIRTPAEQRDPAAVSASQAATRPLLALLDKHLSQQAFIAADRFGMADIPIACEIHRWFSLPFFNDAQRAELPHLTRWFTHLQTRPAAQWLLTMPLS